MIGRISDVTKFIVTGLVGCGASTVLEEMAKRTGNKYLSTDAQFRIYRADPAHPITQEFIEVCQSEGIEIDPSLLADGKKFRDAYGEDVFRDYEDIMMRWMEANGMFENTVVDPSASFLLRSDNLDFMYSKGYRVMLLNTPDEAIFKHLVEGYNGYLSTGKPHWGRYEKVADKAAAALGDDASDGKKYMQALRAIKKEAADDKPARLPYLEKIADFTLTTEATETVSQTTDKVMEFIEDIATNEHLRSMDETILPIEKVR